MSLTIRERTTTLLNFLVRLAGIVGGIIVCSDYGIRTFAFFEQRVVKSKAEPPIPTSIASPLVGSGRGGGQGAFPARSFGAFGDER